MADDLGVADNTVQLLKEITNLLRNLSGEDIVRLLRGEAKLAVVPRSTKSGGGPASLASADIDGIRIALSAMKSREDALSYLDGLKLTRNDLQALNAAFDLPVRKIDKVSDLRNNLVEATIGFRLRSNAIREQ